MIAVAETVFAFERSYGDKKVLAAFNLSAHAVDARAPELEAWRQVGVTGLLEGELASGRLRLPAHGAVFAIPLEGGMMRSNMYRTRAFICALFASLVVAALAATPPARAADAGDSRPAARQSPDWLRDAVIYEVFPRVFSPQGNFQGVIPQLDRLKELGVTVLWLMPIHPQGELKAKGSLGSPYAVRDYDAINPDYGTADDLKKLVDAAHRRDMKVFIDIVANHTAWDSTLIKQHPDWYRRNAAGQIVPPNPDWIDVAQLDYANPALREYMSGMLVRWLRDYQLDGFRCDYAIGVPRDFWESVRPQLDRVRPGLAFMAEADDPALLNRAFDIDYAWDFYHAMSDVLSGPRTRLIRARGVGARRGEVPARRAASAIFRQPRPAPRHRSVRLAGCARGFSGDVHAGWRPAALQRHGGRRHHRVHGASAVRETSHRVGNGRAPPAGHSLLPGPHGTATRASSVHARCGAMAAQ